MSTLKTVIRAVFIDYEPLELAIASKCKNMAVESFGLTQEDLREELRKYLYPQLMRATASSYVSEANRFIIATDIADIVVLDFVPEIIWDPKMILLTKRHFIKKQNGKTESKRLIV